MIPTIKRLAKGLYQALRHPRRTGTAIRHGTKRTFTVSFTATVDFLETISKPDLPLAAVPEQRAGQLDEADVVGCLLVIAHQDCTAF